MAYLRSKLENRRSNLGDDGYYPEVNFPESGGIILPDYNTETPTDFSVIYPSTSYPSTYPSSIPSDSGWNWSSIWGGIKDVIGPVSQATANIIKATSGQPQPSNPNLVRNAAGQLVPVQQSQLQNYLIPALLIGGATIFFLRKKK